MMTVYVAIVAQIFVILGATAAFFNKMGSLTQKVDNLVQDVGEMREELRETSNKTIAIEARTKMKVAHK